MRNFAQENWNSEWLEESEVDWVQATHTHMEQFIAWQMRTRGVKAHIVSRRSSCLSTFYKWCLKHEVVFSDRSEKLTQTYS